MDAALLIAGLLEAGDQVGRPHLEMKARRQAVALDGSMVKVPGQWQRTVFSWWDCWSLVPLSDVESSLPSALLSQLELSSTVCLLVPRRAGDERTAPMSVSTRHASRRTDILTPRPRGQLALQGAIQESFASCAQSHETGKICSSPLTKIFPTDLLKVRSVFQTCTQCERANAASALLRRRSA